MASTESLKAQGLWDYENNRPMTVTASELHPAPTEFSGAILAENPILQFFHYRHLPPRLQETSYKFFALARDLVNMLPRNAERTVALRKLLEAKDAAVRANLPATYSDFKTTRVASEEPIGEPREIINADEDRDGPIDFGS